MGHEKFQDKVALVTGASSGIGLAVAKKLAAEGAKVALVARTQTTLDEAVAAIGASQAAAFPCDVGDFAKLAGLPARVVERFGRLDILVNNAGLTIAARSSTTRRSSSPTSSPSTSPRPSSSPARRSIT